jgi:hypothetical protein
MAETEPFALALFCPHWGGVNYQCPWCRKMHTFKSAGRFLWVTKGHEPEKSTSD